MENEDVKHFIDRVSSIDTATLSIQTLTKHQSKGSRDKTDVNLTSIFNECSNFLPLTISVVQIAKLYGTITMCFNTQRFQNVIRHDFNTQV
jgi:hypothetical protein